MTDQPEAARISASKCFVSNTSATHALIAAVGQFGAGYKFRRVAAALADGGRFWGRPKVKEDWNIQWANGYQ